jgi:Xaa-Pro aminopeptidase
MTGRPPSVILRLSKARAAIRSLALDAFVVSHLPNIRYLTGFSGTAGLVVLTAAECLLIVDFRYRAAARALVGSHAALTEHIKVVVPEQSYDETMTDVLRDVGARRIGVEGAWMPVSRFNKLSATLADSAPTPLRSPDACPALVPTERVIEQARIVKDEEEIAKFREAGRLIGEAAARAVKLVQPGRSEIDVAAELDLIIKQTGFERPAFETIVASGPNSALPHARPTRRVLREGDGVVLDFGGVYDGYCVDLTRTLPLGDVGPDFRRLFAAVAEAQQAAIASVRPGVSANQVDAAARDVLSRYGLEEAFGHGTGHGLGLEVHEEPRIAKARTGLPDVPLEPGMVFTIEPGVYVDGIGGVRIEDDVLVTKAGCEVLTAPGSAGPAGKRPLVSGG